MLYIKKGATPYIFIRTREIDIYLNYENRDKSISVFDEICSSMKK